MIYLLIGIAVILLIFIASITLLFNKFRDDIKSSIFQSKEVGTFMPVAEASFIRVVGAMTTDEWKFTCSAKTSKESINGVEQLMQLSKKEFSDTTTKEKKGENYVG